MPERETHRWTTTRSQVRPRRRVGLLLVAGLASGIVGCEWGGAVDAVPVTTAPAVEAGPGRDAAGDGTATASAAARGAAAVDRLRRELGGALQAAISEGGPMAAVEVCRDQAQPITRALHRSGIALGRTSRRLRNPENAPQPWVEPLLAEFEQTPLPPGGHRVVDLGERGTGYVEPIYLQPLCATCHGQEVAPDLLEKIRAHYPEDRAVGFRVGELRGVFWAVIPDPSD